jgi:hypothetical protein
MTFRTIYDYCSLSLPLVRDPGKKTNNGILLSLQTPLPSAPESTPQEHASLLEGCKQADYCGFWGDMSWRGVSSILPR